MLHSKRLWLEHVGGVSEVSLSVTFCVIYQRAAEASLLLHVCMCSAVEAAAADIYTAYASPYIHRRVVESCILHCYLSVVVL